jgi:hypothetical protein
MAGLMDLLNSDLGKQIIAGVSSQAGTNHEETSSVLASALPALVGAMQNNASTPEGESGLLGALTGGKHDGGILDNLSGFLGGGDFSDGDNILGHVLGGDKENVQNNLSQSKGVGSDKIAMILKIAAPILMGYLAKKALSGGLSNNGASANSGGGLTDILGGLLGGGQTQQQAPAGGGGLLTSILDQDGDGELGIGDAISAVSKGGSGGIGGLLGNLFGK